MAVYISDTKPTSGNVVSLDNMSWDTQACASLLVNLAQKIDAVCGPGKSDFPGVKGWMQKASTGVREDAVMPVDVLGWATEIVVGLTPEPSQTVVSVSTVTP